MAQQKPCARANPPIHHPKPSPKHTPKHDPYPTQAAQGASQGTGRDGQQAYRHAARQGLRLERLMVARGLTLRWVGGGLGRAKVRARGGRGWGGNYGVVRRRLMLLAVAMGHSMPSDGPPRRPLECSRVRAVSRSRARVAVRV